MMGLFAPILRKLLPSFYNDALLRPLRRHYQGLRAQSDKIAIYVIFPQFGVLESHLHALRYMVDNSYSPVIVSNLPLSETDLAKVKPLAWRIVERENFGYDFGGFRDAVLDLAPELPDLNRLVFLNDSSWFPMQGSQNWLKCAQDSGADIYGAEGYEEVKRYPPRAYKQAVWEIDLGGQRVFYGAYAISIGPKVLGDPHYLEFWKRLRLTDGKSRTVRRGEQGHCHWLRRHGYRSEALSKSYLMVDNLANMTDAEFDQLWRFLFVSNLPEVQAEYAALERDFTGDAARDLRKKLVALHIARTGTGICIPHYAITAQGFPFLKKNASGRSWGRNIPTLRTIIAALDDPLSPLMLQELDSRAPAEP